MRLLHLFALGVLPLGALGCHSAVIEATLTNNTTEPIQLIEVDYPSASFGTQSLAPGQAFHYRFKVLGSGPLKLNWTDSSRHDHTVTGPMLQEGTEGSLAIAVTPSGATWKPSFKPHS